MTNLCEHCEYGSRFTDLGMCPECKIGRIIGDCHTKDIYCSTGSHRITTLGISFCGKKNCDISILWTDYEIIITSKLSLDQIRSITPLTTKRPLQIYKAIEQQTSFCDKVYFENMVKIARYLVDHDIHFQVIPEIPVFTKFDECNPHLADDYKWILENKSKKELSDS